VFELWLNRGNKRNFIFFLNRVFFSGILQQWWLKVLNDARLAS